MENGKLQADSADRGWERRAHTRVPMAAWVLVDESRVALSQDISPGGLSLAHEGGAPLGKVLNLWLLLPDSSDVECQAEVVYQGNERLGLRFLGMQKDDMESLFRCLHSAEASGVRRVPRASS